MAEPGTPEVPVPGDTFYGMLGGTERRWLHARGDVRVYQPGYIMTVEGQPAEDVMVVLHGLAAASCRTEGKAEMPLRLYGPGDIIGGETVLGSGARPETVRALARCSALVIPAAQFAELHRSAGVARAFGMAMTRRARDADQQARTRVAPPLARLARVLLYFAARTAVGEAGTVTLPVELSQDTLATWMAASRATVARQLAELRRRGAVSTGYRTITITHPARLRLIAGYQCIEAISDSNGEPPEPARDTRQRPSAVPASPAADVQAAREAKAFLLNRPGAARVLPAQAGQGAALVAPGSEVLHADLSSGPIEPMTQREHEVIELVAMGLSNRAIAERLVVSPRTVERHIANVMLKLGLSSRVQVALWVIETSARWRDEGRYMREVVRQPLARDRAIGGLLFPAGIRIADLTALDVDDVAQPGQVIIRYGKGSGSIAVPVDPYISVSLSEWKRERATWPGAGADRALFLDRRGGRLSARSAAKVLVNIVVNAGLVSVRHPETSAGIVRHTFGPSLLRSAGAADVGTVAELIDC